MPYAGRIASVMRGKNLMSSLEVDIVRLDPMRVAYTHGFGESPEPIAWDQLVAWMEEKGFKFEDHLFFGFNNPDPSPGSPNYGYEQWMTVDAAVLPEGEVKVKDFAGGLYAVTRCKLPEIGAVWKRLAVWREDSPYQCAHHQWLEKAITPPSTPFEDMVLDLYLPIAE
jgi:DNA gyrase inhibitor GyrI